jgi:hypothetical protein
VPEIAPRASAWGPAGAAVGLPAGRSSEPAKGPAERHLKVICALVERKKLPPSRAGGRLLFDFRELQAWVEREG